MSRTEVQLVDRGVPTPDEIVGQNIRWHRKRIGYSQQHMARLLGRSKGWLSPREKGRKVSASDMYEICSLLEISVFDLMLPPDISGIDQVLSNTPTLMSDTHTVSVESYTEALFHLPARALTSGAIEQMKWSFRLQRLRDGILECHPDVRASVALLEEALEEQIGRENAAMVLEGRLAIEAKDGRLLDRRVAAEMLVQARDIDIDLDNINIEGIIARTAELSTDVAKLTAEGIARIDKKIRDGLIPEVPIPKRVPSPLDPSYESVVNRIWEIDEGGAFEDVEEEWLRMIDDHESEV